MKCIVHLIFSDKFTDGYISFMRKIMCNVQHKFIIHDNSFTLSSVGDDIIFIKKYNELISNGTVKNYLLQSDKVIVSGFFTGEKVLVKFPKCIFEKMYIHLWGGDFYPYDNNVNLFHIRKYIRYKLKKRCFLKCAGIITLVQNDYQEVERIFNISNNHFVAPMPGDPDKQNDFEKIKNKQDITTDNIRIIVGNSATESNQHREIFDMLTNFDNEKFVVIVPLSYGDDEYKKQIIDYGYLKLKDKFVPLTEYMKKDEYLNLLSSCNIGIFNNNRQQGMGNISSLLQLGKKVFVREGTAMWSHYETLGVTLHGINEIPEARTLSELCYIGAEERIQNILAIDKMRSMDNIKEKWQAIFDDKTSVLS